MGKNTRNVLKKIIFEKFDSYHKNVDVTTGHMAPQFINNSVP